MIMRYPATRWQDALPTGSGAVGALVYGNIQNDTILLNHEALYYPKPPPQTVDVSDRLPEVRRLIRAGQYTEAAQQMPEAYRERSGGEIGTTSAGCDPYQPFYDYYLFTGDIEFLRSRAVPWLKEAALFYEDFLEEGEDGRWRFSPSLSPENQPLGGHSLLTVNAAMDVAVCRETLANLCRACAMLQIESAGAARWRAMLKKLPDYSVNEDGAMTEWLHPSFKDNISYSGCPRTPGT